MDKGQPTLLFICSLAMVEASSLPDWRKSRLTRQARILWEDQEGNEQKVRTVERSMLQLLNNGNPDERFFSLYFLTTTPWLQKVTWRHLEAFRKDPENKKVVSQVESRIPLEVAIVH